VPWEAAAAVGEIVGATGVLLQRLHAVELLDSYDEAGIAEDELVVAGRQVIVRLAAKPGFQQWWMERGQHALGRKFTVWVHTLIESE
jgi:hypothetical protein